MTSNIAGGDSAVSIVGTVVPCKWPLPLAIGAILSNDSNMQALAIAVAAQNGSDGKLEGPLR